MNAGPASANSQETHSDRYVREVMRAAFGLYRHSLLLDEDVQRYIAAAEASSIGK